MTRKLTTATAVLIGSSIVVATAVTFAWCTHANAAEMPDARAMMQRVERALVENGFSEAQGYGALEMPVVALTTDLPNRDKGSYTVVADKSAYLPGKIELDADQPEGCLPISLAHELSHDAAVRMNLVPFSIPNWLVKTELQKIAGIVERAVELEGPQAPNCLMKRIAER